MSRFWVFLGILVTLGWQVDLLLAYKDKICKHLIGELGDGQSKFIYCATTKSVPVNLCLGCELEYHNLRGEFEALLANANCSKQYLNSDRINIVATTQGILTELWQKANCDDCFQGNNSLTYNDLSSELDKCLTLPLHKNNVCFACKDQYVKLNTFYLTMEKSSMGQVCFDLQDNMNRTRLNWSKTLKCCQREVKLESFLIAVCVVVLLPILTFYSTVIVVTKRREANHGLLNEQEPELDAPSTSALITAALLSTRTAEPAVVSARTEKLAQVFNQTGAAYQSDDSGTEEHCLKPKVVSRAAPDTELDSSSDDEPALMPKVL
ncbi:hypothetical protein KR009_003040, partial [Drosophila setifemur]